MTHRDVSDSLKVILTIVVLLAGLGMLIWKVKLLRALTLGVAFGAIMALVR